MSEYGFARCTMRTEGVSAISPEEGGRRGPLSNVCLVGTCSPALALFRASPAAISSGGILLRPLKMLLNIAGVKVAEPPAPPIPVRLAVVDAPPRADLLKPSANPGCTDPPPARIICGFDGSRN